jgi:hypothetical protein
VEPRKEEEEGKTTWSDFCSYSVNYFAVSGGRKVLSSRSVRQITKVKVNLSLYLNKYHATKTYSLLN